MAAVSWTLARANGDTRTFAAWGIKSAAARAVNSVAGGLDLGFGASDLLGNLPFDPDETVLVAADGAPFFRGRIIGETRGAYGSNEGLTLKLADPWWYLQQLIYQHPATVVADWHSNPTPADPAGLQPSDFVTVQKTISQIIVSQDQNLATVNTHDQILDVLNFAIGKGAPIALGTIDPGDSMPRDLARDITCAEMIAKSLRWTPDQAAFWDYSVDPPALNIRTRANRALLSIDIADQNTAQVEINPRRDLVRTGVRINYLRSHQRNNFAFNTVDQDDAGPNPAGIGALVVTLELFGSYINNGFLIDEEPTPDGLATRLYNAYSILPFEGRIVLVGDDVDPAAVYLGKTLRILHGAPDWATATMDVQQIAQDLFSGRTELSVGPPTQLGPTDLVGLVRKGRTVAPTLLNVIGGPGGPNTPTIPPVNGTPRLEFGLPHVDVILRYNESYGSGAPGCHVDTNIVGCIKEDFADVYDARGGTLLGRVFWSSLTCSEGGTGTFYGVVFGKAHQTTDHLSCELCNGGTGVDYHDVGPVFQSDYHH
jgi:hypothetical protein